MRGATPEPSPANQGDQPFHTALEAGSRAGSNLSELSKIVAELSAGLSGAKQANERLVHELSALRAMLGAANEQQLAQTQRIALLEQELMVSQSAAERERQFLTAQHDDFLAAILDEHEEALRAERDEANARADKRERERDELRAEASQLRARLGAHRAHSTAPSPPLTSRRPPSFRPPLALELDRGELDSSLHPSRRLPSVRPRLTPATSAAEGALSTPQPLANAPVAEPFPRESTRPGVGGPKPSEPAAPPSFGPPPSGWTPLPPAPEVRPARPTVISAASLPTELPSQWPALKQKPDPTTRPLIDYSLGKDRVLSETLEGARISSKPPRK